MQSLSCVGGSEVCGYRSVVLFESKGRRDGGPRHARVDGVDLQSSLAPTREATAEPSRLSILKMSTAKEALVSRKAKPMAYFCDLSVCVTHDPENTKSHNSVRK